MKPVRIITPFLVLALLAGCAKHEESAATVASSLPPARIRLAAVRVEEVPTLTDVTGTVRPVQRAMIAAKVMGAIEELPVALGQRVKAGDLLVRISAGEISAKVVQAQSQLHMAQRDLERERDLLTKNASTAEMVKNLEDRFAMTQAMVHEAETMLSYTVVRAPFDGVVARKMADAGSLSAPGQPLLEIEGTTAFQVEAGVPDSLAPRLAAGTPLTVEVPAAGVTFTGALVELSSASDAFARNVPAKISVPADTPVRSGQFARVQVPGAPVHTMLVPAAAVSTLGQIERVFVDSDNRAVLRLVKTGQVRGDRVEIVSGLADGDRIVLNPPDGLREGRLLEVQP